ncbi:MAG: ferredoxin [Candidatus Gracilibacteria bacterium]
MPFKIVHFQNDCIGCNSCVNIAPQSWMMDEKEGKAVLVGGKKKKAVFVAEVFDCDLEANERAAEACPMRIIQINR